MDLILRASGSFSWDVARAELCTQMLEHALPTSFRLCGLCGQWYRGYNLLPERFV